jgi:hypothetical protein
MGYTHVIGDDHRKVAEQLGGFFAKFALICPRRKTAHERKAPKPLKCKQMFGCGGWI